MKIVRIIARLNIGGPARNAVLLSGLGETVLVCGEVGSGEGDMMYLAREKGIEPVIVPELGRELSLRDDWRAFWKIYGIIRQEKPDIVHTHTAKAGTLGRLAGILYRIMDSRFRGNDRAIILIHTFHGHVFYGYFGKIKSWVFLWIEKILSLFTDKVITVSETLKKELVERFRIAPEKKFSVVELGFELDGLLDLPMKEESDVIKIGIVGRLVPVKNHRMLFRVVNLCRAGLNLPYKAVVIGDGEMKKELKNYAKELGIEDMVEFRGWIKDVAEIYRDLDIVVLTSLNEGTPVSIIEAMAAARPVVATDVGGVRDIVEDGKSGYLVDSGNETDFVKRLTDLVKDSNKREAFGRYGRESVRNRFSKARLMKDMEEVYGFLLSQK